MNTGANKILFSIDLEEFDIPEEYGHAVPVREKLDVSLNGMLKLQDLMQDKAVISTVFCTAYWAAQFPELIVDLASTHELASHSFYHNSFKIEDLYLSRQQLQDISGQQVTGLRMPRMQKLSEADIVNAGYLYDSSLHPTWLPGRYNHLRKPRTVFKKNGLWTIPVSVTPNLRLPVFWLAFKNFPFDIYKRLCLRILKTDGYLAVYVHPWEFTDLSPYKLPAYVKRVCNDQLLGRLSQLFDFFRSEGEFITHHQFITNQTGGFNEPFPAN